MKRNRIIGTASLLTAAIMVSGMLAGCSNVNGLDGLNGLNININDGSVSVDQVVGDLIEAAGLDDGSETLLYNKVQTNGSIAHITAIFGFSLAGLVIKNCAQMTNDK